jgi:CTD kinase subunit beta
LDLLELYTHHRSNTVLGPRFPLEAFLTIRIPLNREAEDNQLPRFTNWQRDTTASPKPNGAKAAKHANHKGKLENREKNGLKDTPANPLTPTSATGEKMLTGGDRGREGTVRFMLDPERAKSEKTIVSEFFRVEMEEFEVDDD